MTDGTKPLHSLIESHFNWINKINWRKSVQKVHTIAMNNHWSPFQARFLNDSHWVWNRIQCDVCLLNSITPTQQLLKCVPFKVYIVNIFQKGGTASPLDPTTYCRLLDLPLISANNLDTLFFNPVKVWHIFIKSWLKACRHAHYYMQWATQRTIVVQSVILSCALSFPLVAS